MPRLPSGRSALVATLLGGFAACSDSGAPREPARQNHSAHPIRQLVSRAVDAGDELGMPADMALVGHYLVVLNTRGDSAVRVYDVRTDKLIRSFGREGAGPGEFLAAWSLDPEPGSASAFWIFDIGLQRFTRVDLAQDFRPGSRYGQQSVSLREAGPVASPVWSGDSLLVSPGFFQQGGSLAHIDPAGRLRRIVGDDPPGSEGTPMQVRQHAYQRKARPNADRSLFAVGTRHADRLEILRLSGVRIAAAERLANFEPVYQTADRGGQPSMDTGDELRFGYIDVATTPARIYALYSGRRRADVPGQANYGEYVYVYDWHARLLEVLHLDVDALTIEVDEAQEKLYAVRHNPAPAVVVSDLRSGPSASARRPR